MNALVPIPVILPLLGAALSITFGRSRVRQRAIGLTVLTAVTIVCVALLIAVDRTGTIVVHAGGWPAPMGITLVADRFATVMLVLGAVMLLSVLIYAIGEPGAERNHVGFQSVY
ncbi:MAG TPA: hypothetical protein VK891_00685, partial [Euzebyales bacterium]|nr:hypothetical protein [Euzebyales bacterium]